MAEVLLITTTDIKRNSVVSGSVDVDKFIQYLKIAQDIHIHELLGGNLYQKLQDDVLSNSLSGDYLHLVTKHIKPLLAQYALLEFLPFSQFTISNKGVFKHTSEASESLTKSDVSMMVEATRDTAQNYASRMVDYICNYPSKFPEYYTNTKDQLSPNKDTSFGGWHI